MMNYIGELIVIIGAFITGMFCVCYTVKYIFDQCDRFCAIREARNEKLLKRMLMDAKTIFFDAIDEIQKKEEKNRQMHYDIDRSRWKESDE